MNKYVALVPLLFAAPLAAQAQHTVTPPTAINLIRLAP